MSIEERPTRTMVLIAEDDDLLRDLVSGSLRAKGYTVIESPRGDLAYSKLGETPVDILVTDIGLPGLDGWSLAGQARQRDPGVLVIYMSSKPNDPAKQVRPSVYLQKPFHPDALIDAIQQLTSPELEPE